MKATGHQHLDFRGHATGEERRRAQLIGAGSAMLRFPIAAAPGEEEDLQLQTLASGLDIIGQVVTVSDVYQRRQSLGDVWHWAEGHGVRRWHEARLWARHRRRNARTKEEVARWRRAQEAYGRKEHQARQRAEAQHHHGGPLDGGDDVTVSLIPRSWNAPGFAVGGYGVGLFVTFQLVRAQFPHAHHVYYAIRESDDPPMGVNKAYLDCEPGDATLEQFPGWYKRQRGRGIPAHALGQYCSISQLAQAEQINRNAGLRADEYDAQSAHYGRGKHVCNQSCGFGIVQADSTQWTDRFNGVSLDATHYLHF